MNPAAAALIAKFEAAAGEAQRAEEALRKRLSDEIARSERHRAFAFRRTNFVRTLAVASVGTDAEEVALASQRRAMCEELGWTDPSAAHEAILDRLEPLGRAVWRCACGAEAATTAAVHAELEAFEAWFEGAHGKSFYALFDQYVPEVPVVDF
jgi:hypothetical protein